MSSTDEISETNRKAMIIAIIAGILLFASGMSGVAAWEEIKDFVSENIADNIEVQIAFSILILIASLGGIGVIIGGVLIGKNKVRTGRLIIGIGVGTGLIGLIFSLVVAIKEESLNIGAFIGLGAVGIVLSIAARVVAKKEKHQKERSNTDK
ncbi:MAG: hypothetical protein KAU14_01560 [Thermoplasmata archaeon]|nr:hypothetical protein [Thermoplasmata archaeon]